MTLPTRRVLTAQSARPGASSPDPDVDPARPHREAGADVRAGARADVRAGARADVRAGARAMAPMILAYAPFGLLVGSAAAASANPLAAWLATWPIYGGAAHLAVLDVLSHGSGWAAAAAIGLLVNARQLAYATAMSPQWRTAPPRQRVLAAVMLTDATWALTRNHEARPGVGVAATRRFYFGAGATLFVGWPILVSLGVLAGDWVAAVPITGLLSAMTLGSVVVSGLRDRPAVIAVATAAVSAVLTLQLPAALALAVAATTGVCAGMVAEAAGRSRAGRDPS